MGGREIQESLDIPFHRRNAPLLARRKSGGPRYRHGSASRVATHGIMSPPEWLKLNSSGEESNQMAAGMRTNLPSLHVRRPKSYRATLSCHSLPLRSKHGSLVFLPESLHPDYAHAKPSRSSKSGCDICISLAHTSPPRAMTEMASVGPKSPLAAARTS